MASHVSGVVRMTVDDEIGVHMAPEDVVTDARANHHSENEVGLCATCRWGATPHREVQIGQCRELTDNNI